MVRLLGSCGVSSKGRGCAAFARAPSVACRGCCTQASSVWADFRVYLTFVTSVERLLHQAVPTPLRKSVRLLLALCGRRSAVMHVAGAGRERVHRWWHTKQLADNRVIMGKPSVLFRKVINTRVGDEIVAVNAQQYAVLVMDVPNLHKESTKYARPRLWLPTSQYMRYGHSHAPWTHRLKNARVGLQHHAIWTIRRRRHVLRLTGAHEAESAHVCRLMKQAKQQMWWMRCWWSIWVCLQKHVRPAAHTHDPLACCCVP